ncbi:MAG: ThiF family adenylyltransferase [candidate division WOR-3 bacterium]
MRYKDLIIRNQFIIPKKLQNKIKKCRIFLLGCGLGSQIALLAVRMGFINFILVDGDKVTPDNLNRQAFRYEHLGKNKAEALASMIKDVNPRAKVEFYPIFLKDKKLAKRLIDKSDVVVNMADPDEIMYFVNDYAQTSGKVVFFPLNIVWGGYVLVFTPDSPKIRDIVGKRIIKGNRFYLKLLQKTFTTFPSSILKLYKKMGNKLLKQLSVPQLGAAAFLNSSIIVSGIIKWLSDQPLKKAPHPIFLDIWEEV